MARKLTFLLTDRIAWKLLVRTALGFLALLSLKQFSFSFWALVSALAVFSAVYFSEIPERKLFRRSFLAIVLLGLVGFGIFADFSQPLFWAFAVLWTLGFWAILGIVGFFFTNRELVYSVLSTLLFFFAFLIFFYLDRGGNFWFLGFILLTLVVFLLTEAFRVFEIGSPRRAALWAWAAAFVLLELAWILNFLPLGFVNAALFLTLVSVIIRETIISHFRGKLDLPLILRELATILVFGLIIFAASSWSI